MTPDHLKQWRAAMGFTQQKAAETLGYGRAYYAEFETGGRKIPILLPLACAAIWLGIKPWPEIMKGFTRK